MTLTFEETMPSKEPIPSAKANSSNVRFPDAAVREFIDHLCHLIARAHYRKVAENGSSPSKSGVDRKRRRKREN